MITQADVDAHVLGCNDCLVFNDGGFYFCREGARLNQEALKLKMLKPTLGKEGK